MKKKNPAIAAVLNFFLPGWGFVYLGSPIMIVTGIALFICVLASSYVLWALSLLKLPSCYSPFGN